MSTTLIRTTGDYLTFDVAFVSFDNSSTITDHPVEMGASVSDNAQRMPQVITITGTVSETCYDYQVNGALVGRRGSAAIFLDTIQGSILSPAEEVIIDNETVGQFFGYMLQTWSFGITNVQASEFICVFRQVSKATATFTGIPASVPVPSASSSFGAGTNAGEQGTTSTTAAGAPGGAAGEASDKASIAYSLFGG